MKVFVILLTDDSGFTWVEKITTNEEEVNKTIKYYDDECLYDARLQTMYLELNK